MSSHPRPAVLPLAFSLVLLILGTTGSFAEPTVIWYPSVLGAVEVPETAELYYDGLDGRLIGIGPGDLGALKAQGAQPLDLSSGEEIYVFLVEDSEQAEFVPPTRVLWRSGHEVVVATPGVLPRLTDQAKRNLTGLRQPIRIDRHPVPWPEMRISPPVAPREINPLIEEMIASLSADSQLSTWQTLDDFETRYVYTSQNEQASQWILDEFLAMGLDAEFHYYNQSGQRRNVIATLPGLVDPTKVVYICAHFDAISGTPETCAPGADDNASGSTAVIETARVLSQYPFEYTIKFACFNGEEQGLVGSAAYVADVAAEGEDVIAAYNCDMISYRGNDTAPPDLVIYTNNASVALATTIESVCNEYLPGLLEPIVIVDAMGSSDHASFWSHGYPAVVSIEDEAWGDDFCPWYHTCDDRIEQYPHDYVLDCTKANIGAVATLAAPINPDGSFLAFSSALIDDDLLGGSNGNGDGSLNPGETIELWVTLRNLGQQTSTNISGLLTIESEDVTILDETASWTDIPSGGEGTNDTAFRFFLSSSAFDSETLVFLLTMTDDDRVREISIPLSVVAPLLAYHSHTIDDVVHGNGNGIPEPGEVVLLAVSLGNTGGQDALDIEATLSSENPHVIPIDDVATNLSIPAGLTGELSPPYRIAISDEASEGEVLSIDLGITAGQGYATATGFTLRVGSYFFDDVEAEGAWSLSAAGDDAASGRWVRVDPNGTTYNGEPCQPEDDHTADPGTDCFVTGQGDVGGSAGQADVDGGTTTLTSPTFDLTQLNGPRISYWRWYTNDLGNNPGEDEWVVEVSSDGGAGWVDLERTTASANSWQEHSFLVSDFVTPTAEVVIRFIASDTGGGSLVEAGVDDFMITGEPATVGTDGIDGPLVLRLDPARPNPTASRTTLSFTVPSAGHVTLRLYGVDGRLVRNLLDESIAAGAHRIDWDGLGERGAKVAPGVYFARMQAADRELKQRIILLR